MLAVSRNFVDCGSIREHKALEARTGTATKTYQTNVGAHALKTGPPEGGPANRLTTHRWLQLFSVTYRPGYVGDMHGAIRVDTDESLHVSTPPERRTPTDIAIGSSLVAASTGRCVAAVVACTAAGAGAAASVRVIAIGMTINGCQLIIVVSIGILVGRVLVIHA